MDRPISYEELLDRDGRFVYTFRGVSMMPLLRQDRDLVVIEKAGPRPCRRYDIVLFRRPKAEGGHAYVLHRILRVLEDGTFWIVGDNCLTGDTVPPEQILGVMTAIVRGGRTIPVSSLGCRLYELLWCRPYKLRIAVQWAYHFARGFAARCRHKIKTI